MDDLVDYGSLQLTELARGGRKLKQDDGELLASQDHLLYISSRDIPAAVKLCSWVCMQCRYALCMQCTWLS